MDEERAVRAADLDGLGLDPTVQNDLIKLFNSEMIKLRDLQTLSLDDYRAMGVKMGVIAALRRRFGVAAAKPAPESAMDVSTSESHSSTSLDDGAPNLSSLDECLSPMDTTNKGVKKLLSVRLQQHYWASPSMAGHVWQPDTAKTLLWNMTSRVGVQRPDIRWFDSSDALITLPPGVNIPAVHQAACELDFSRFELDSERFTLRLPHGDLGPSAAANFLALLALADIFYLPVNLPPNYTQQCFHAEIRMLYQLNSAELKSLTKVLAKLQSTAGQPAYDHAYQRAEFLLSIANDLKLNQFMTHMYRPPNKSKIQKNRIAIKFSGATEPAAMPALSPAPRPPPMPAPPVPAPPMPISFAPPSAADGAKETGARVLQQFAMASSSSSAQTSSEKAQSQVDIMLENIQNAAYGNEEPIETLAACWKTHGWEEMARLLHYAKLPGWTILKEFFMHRCSKASSVQQLLAFFAQGITSMDAAVRHEVLLQFDLAFVDHLHAIAAWCNSFDRLSTLSVSCIANTARVMSLLLYNLPVDPSNQTKSSLPTTATATAKIAKSLELASRQVLSANKPALVKTIEVFKTCSHLPLCLETAKSLQLLLE